MSALAAPAGNPDLLDQSVRTYEATEQALANAAARIESTLADGEGKAIDELRDRSGRATSEMSAAHERYSAAASALRDYAVHLRDFHTSAHAAIADHEAAQSRLHHANWQVGQAHEQVRAALLQPDMPYLLDEAQQALRVAHAAVDQAQEAASAAQAAYHRAAEALDEAARVAAARIRDGFEATKDGALDWLKKAFEALGNLLTTLAEWAVAFFKEVVQLIVDAVALFLVSVLIALVLVALVAVLAVALVGAAVVAYFMILEALAEYLRLVVTTGLDWALNALGVDARMRLRIALLLLMVVEPELGALLLQRLLIEATAPTPEVTVVDNNALPADERLAESDGLDDILAWGGAVDEMGKGDEAVVDIAKVVGPDGEVSWIVTLPSTQDWVFGGDQPAPNDLDADLILMLFPEVRTQYERAVMEAMAQAGIAADEPVLLNGWSLGGIMAGHLAETHAGGYSYAGVLAAGAPIDHMSIDVPVLEVKHHNDPVHLLDMVDHVSNSEQHVEFWDGALSGLAFSDIKFDNVVGHSNNAYVDTLGDHLRYGSTADDLAGYFPDVITWADGADGPMAEGTTIVHTQYAFHE